MLSAADFLTKTTEQTVFGVTLVRALNQDPHALCTAVSVYISEMV